MKRLILPLLALTTTTTHAQFISNSVLSGVNVVVTITVPTTNSTYDNGTADTLTTLSGTAVSDRGIPSACTWTNSLGGSGTTTGTTSWSISDIALTVGSNVLTVTCTDGAGTQSTDVLTVARASSGGSCTTTISSGLPAAMSAAAGGATICLSAGSWGTVTIPSVTKSPRVTVKSESGQTASINLQLDSGAVNGVTFDSLTITGAEVSWPTHDNITIQNSAFTGGIDIVTCNMNDAGTSILLTNNTHIQVSAPVNAQEGRVTVYCSQGQNANRSGVTITYSLFENTSTCSPGSGESDGIQSGGNGLTVGPGNIFRNLTQGSCGRHIDAIQGYGSCNLTITGNWFIGNTIHIGQYDQTSDCNGSATGDVVTGNVFDGSGFGRPIQYAAVGSTWTHNTFRNVGEISYGAKPGDDPSSGFLIRDNIYIGTLVGTFGGQGTCTSCTAPHNLVSTNSSIASVFNPSSTVSGTATFMGGETPSTWAGYQLTTSSLGYQAATDPVGSDMGVTTYGE